MFKGQQVVGKCLGVSFEPRGPNDNHICIRLLVEDDENWIPTSLNVSSYWLDDLIETLQRAKIMLEAEGVPCVVDGRQWGWDFPEGE